MSSSDVYLSVPPYDVVRSLVFPCLSDNSLHSGVAYFHFVLFDVSIVS